MLRILYCYSTTINGRSMYICMYYWALTECILMWPVVFEGCNDNELESAYVKQPNGAI